jgi:MFS family permease
MNPRARHPVHPWHLAAGFVLWLVWFALLYGAQGIGCAVAAPPAQQGSATGINVLLGLWTLAFFFGFAVAAVLMARVASRQGRQGWDEVEPSPLARFVAPTAAVLYGACAVCTLVVGLPVLVVPPCV